MTAQTVIIDPAEALLASVEPTIAQVAWRTAKRFGWLDVDDLAQSLRLAFWANRGTFLAHASDDNFGGYLFRAMSYEASRIAKKERNALWPDWVVYSSATVEEMLASLFDRADWTTPPAADPGTGTFSRRDPAEGNDRLASMCDLSFAFDRLPAGRKQLIEAVYRDGFSFEHIATWTGSLPDSVRRSHDRTVESLSAIMSGVAQDRDYHADCA